MSLTTKAPLGWGGGTLGDWSVFPRNKAPGHVVEDTMRTRLLALIAASEAGPARELELWLQAAGDQRVQSVASWFAAWAFQRPLFLQGCLLGYEVPGHDVLHFVREVGADAGPPVSVEFGHVKAQHGESIVVRYDFQGLEPVVFSRCPRLPAEGWPMPTELPPMPDAWRQEAPDFAFALAKTPAAHELLVQWGPARLDVGLDRTKRAALGACHPSGAGTLSGAGPPATSSVSRAAASAPTTTGSASQTAPGAAVSAPTGLRAADPTKPSPTSSSSPSARTTSAPSGPTSSPSGAAGGFPNPPARDAELEEDGPAEDAGSPDDEGPPDDYDGSSNYTGGGGAGGGDASIGEQMEDALADLGVNVDNAGPPDARTTYIPIAVVLCVLCHHKERLKLADVVERFKAGCVECKRDPSALTVLEEENGGTKPLVHYLRAAGVALPPPPTAAAAAPAPMGAGLGGAPPQPSAGAPAAAPASTTSEPRRRPSRKKAGAGEH